MGGHDALCGDDSRGRGGAARTRIKHETQSTPSRPGEVARSVQPVFRFLVASKGGRLFDRGLISGPEPTSVLFSQWSKNALLDIEDLLAGRSKSKRRSVGEWRFPLSLEKWRTAVNSDFLLLTLFRDAYQDKAPAIAQVAPRDSSDAYNQLGVIDAQRGDLQQAIANWQKAVEVDPGNESAQAKLQRARMMLR